MKSRTASFTIIGVAWMLVWALSFNTSMSLTKVLSNHVSTFVIVFVRVAFGLMFVLPLAIKERKVLFQTRRLPLHGLRVLFACTAMVCTYYAYSRLPLAFATSIGFTAPIITAVLSVIVLGDRLKPLQWALIALGYAGVLVMVRPGDGIWDPTIFVALAANFFASCSIISVKKLSSTETPTQILFYFNFMGFCILGLLCFGFWEMPPLRDLVILMCIGGTATFSQYALIRALQNGDPSVLSPFEYSRLVISIPIGLFIFDEIPTLWSIYGSLIVVMSNLFMALYERRHKSITAAPCK